MLHEQRRRLLDELAFAESESAAKIAAIRCIAAQVGARLNAII